MNTKKTYQIWFIILFDRNAKGNDIIEEEMVIQAESMPIAVRKAMAFARKRAKQENFKEELMPWNNNYPCISGLCFYKSGNIEEGQATVYPLPLVHAVEAAWNTINACKNE